MKQISIIAFVFFSLSLVSQSVYKTPTGTKYHLASCRMVENVSSKLDGENDINRFNLTPCKICKPPKSNQISKEYFSSDKAVGVSTSIQCKGTTLKGTRCNHVTKMANGYCYQHSEQSTKLGSNSYKEKSEASTPTCGAQNKTGGFCKRRVKGGGRCYQHS